MFTYATAIKASLKSIRFSANGTNSLENIDILSVDDQAYSEHIPMPLWALENTGMATGGPAPFWGIVHDRYEHYDTLFTTRSDQLYLPPAGFIGVEVLNALPGVDYFQGAMQEAYSNDSIIDYSGRNQYGLYMRWQGASVDAHTVALIPNLIWTDTMANALVGANSRDGSHGDPEIYKYQRVVEYDYRYSIPAFLLLALWFPLVLSAFSFWLSSRVTLPALRQLLNLTAPGRAVHNIVYPDTGGSTAATSVWVRSSGVEVIGLMGPQDGTQQPTGYNVRTVGPVDSPGLRFTGSPGDTRVGDILKM